MSSPVALLSKVYRYWRNHGTQLLLRALFRKAREAWRMRDFQNADRDSIVHVLLKRFPQTRPFGVFSVLGSEPRVNLVTDSINGGSLYGGVGTGILLARILSATIDMPLRVITRTEPAEKRFFADLLSVHGFSVTENVEFLFAPNNGRVQVDVNDRDIFLTTSWWTTECVQRALGAKRIIYLLQEDERMFYPCGDDHRFCSCVLSNREILFVINSCLLMDHFRSEGFYNICENGISFEPAFPKHVFFYRRRPTKQKKKFLFYARPNNPRNLFFFGLEIIDAAVSRGILDLDEWQITLVGKDIPDLRIADCYQPVRKENLRWSEYAEFIGEIDLGLSLMYSPHPSYPPLDLAAAGAVAVTNKFGNKQSLENYSRNILCADLSKEALVDRLAEGVRLALNESLRYENYQQNRLGTDWHEAFRETVAFLSTRVN